MSGAFFEVGLDDTAMTAALDRLENGYENPQPLFEKIGAYGVRSTQERFISILGKVFWGVALFYKKGPRYWGYKNFLMILALIT